MDCFAEEMTKIEAELKKDPLGKNRAQRDVKYDWTGVGCGYQIQDPAKLPQTRFEAREIISQADLDNMKKAIEKW